MGSLVRDDPVRTLRWAWGQLTSMRTALFLLFLLALAAIPGSLIPQQSTNAIAVAEFKRENPTLDAWFEPMGMYHVYTSAWFSAVYLLLFVSLVGCILPRIGKYARTVAAPPPRLVARPGQLPAGHVGPRSLDPEATLQQAERWLRGHRYRLRRSDEGISAERGYAREAGNLTFHVGLVAVLAGLAWSSLLGFHGSSVMVEGQSFANSITQYDDFTAGAWVATDRLEPFALTLNSFAAEFETGEVQHGAARRFDADVTLTEAESTGEHLLQVNAPIITDGGSQVSLLGHGYAPRVTVTDADGEVAFSGPVVFLPQDGNFGSTGVVNAPDARPTRLAFQGFFFPTTVLDETGPHSVFPDLGNPELYLNVWSGPPAEETGIPHSIYVLDTTGLEKVTDDDGEPLSLRLLPGATVELPDGLGTITFDGVSRWVRLQVSQTPGNPLTLGSLAVAALGLAVSLFVRPRRLFVRVSGDQVAVGGLDRTDGAAGLDEEVESLAQAAGLTTSSDSPPGEAQ
ncbi:MAG: cytochrome c biogenesis protein ResB [Arachnia sp.]